MIDWINEKPLIRDAAREKGIDPAFIMAIRHTENGGPGIEFGVEPPGRYAYDEQLRICVTTVAHRLETFQPTNPLVRNTTGRIVYTPRFIAYFAGIWAPLSVANDPTNLNHNWPANCQQAYNDFVLQGD